MFQDQHVVFLVENVAFSQAFVEVQVMIVHKQKEILVSENN